MPIPLLSSLILDFQIALRNLARQPRRSMLSLLIIAGGTMAYLMASGFIEWSLFAMREATIMSHLGHIQIVRPNYFKQGIADPYAYLLPSRAPELDAIRQLPETRILAPRLAFSGLISHGDANLSFLGEGVDPVAEKPLSQWLLIGSGENLGSQPPNAPNPTAQPETTKAPQKSPQKNNDDLDDLTAELSADIKQDQHSAPVEKLVGEVIMGEGLAANLGVKPGDTVTLLVTTQNGGINAVECTVKGLFYSAIKAYDDSTLRMHIDTARKLMHVDGATTWITLLHNTDQTDEVLQKIRNLLPARQYEAVPWYKLADFYLKTRDLFARQIQVVQLIIAVIIILSISNTLSMAVVERTSEIGTVISLGTRRRDILRQFLVEGLLLGLVGGLMGIVLGGVISFMIEKAGGIPMPPPPGATRGFTGQIQVSVALAFHAALLSVITTLLASLWPAWKASRINVVDALRHNR